MKENTTFELNPRLSADSILVGEFPLTSLLMMNDSQFPWFVLVPRRIYIREAYQLNQSDQSVLWRESSSLSQLIMKHFKGDKLNVAAIGNIVSQFHLHHVIRYEKDICWPKPIWGQHPMKPIESIDLKNCLSDLLPKLEKIGLKRALNNRK
ncbi:MAG: HIT family protein [Kangiella sp.]|nr:MAG: HIT family protein [Kangiella sp.]